MEPMIILATDVTLTQKPGKLQQMARYCGGKIMGLLSRKNHHGLSKFNKALIACSNTGSLVPLVNIANRMEERTPFGQLPEDTQKLIQILRDKPGAKGYIGGIISDLPKE